MVVVTILFVCSCLYAAGAVGSRRLLLFFDAIYIAVTVLARIPFVYSMMTIQQVFLVNFFSFRRCIVHLPTLYENQGFLFVSFALQRTFSKCCIEYDGTYGGMDINIENTHSQANTNKCKRSALLVIPWIIFMCYNRTQVKIIIFPVEIF